MTLVGKLRPEEFDEIDYYRNRGNTPWRPGLVLGKSAA